MRRRDLVTFVARAAGHGARAAIGLQGVGRAAYLCASMRGLYKKFDAALGDGKR
jgi:hypothetical protein